MDPSYERTWTFPPDPTMGRVVRQHVADACWELASDTVDIARLLVSELFANAVEHGSGAVVLVVARYGSTLRVEVHDGSPVQPVIREPASVGERGMGLRAVAAMASDWGVAWRPDGRPGKSVWFSLE